MNIIIAVRAIAEASGVLFVAVDLPSGVGHLVVKTVMFGVAVGGVAGSGVWTGIAHHGVIHITNRPIVGQNVVIFFSERDEQDLGVDVVGLGGVVDNFGGGKHAFCFFGIGVEGGLTGTRVFVVVGETNIGRGVVIGVAGCAHHFGIFVARRAGVDEVAVDITAAADWLGPPSVTGGSFGLEEIFNLLEGHGVFVVKDSIVDDVGGVEIGGLDGADRLGRGAEKQGRCGNCYED